MAAGTARGGAEPRWSPWHGGTRVELARVQARHGGGGGGQTAARTLAGRESEAALGQINASEEELVVVGVGTGDEPGQLEVIARQPLAPATQPASVYGSLASGALLLAQGGELQALERTRNGVRILPAAGGSPELVVTAAEAAELAKELGENNTFRQVVLGTFCANASEPADSHSDSDGETAAEAEAAAAVVADKPAKCHVRLAGALDVLDCAVHVDCTIAEIKRHVATACGIAPGAQCLSDAEGNPLDDHLKVFDLIRLPEVEGDFSAEVHERSARSARSDSVLSDVAESVAFSSAALELDLSVTAECPVLLELEEQLESICTAAAAALGNQDLEAWHWEQRQVTLSHEGSAELIVALLDACEAFYLTACADVVRRWAGQLGFVKNAAFIPTHQEGRAAVRSVVPAPRLSRGAPFMVIYDDDTADVFLSLPMLHRTHRDIQLILPGTGPITKVLFRAPTGQVKLPRFCFRQELERRRWRLVQEPATTHEHRNAKVSVPYASSETEMGFIQALVLHAAEEGRGAALRWSRYRWPEQASSGPDPLPLAVIVQLGGRALDICWKQDVVFALVGDDGNDDDDDDDPAGEAAHVAVVLLDPNRGCSVVLERTACSVGGAFHVEALEHGRVAVFTRQNGVLVMERVPDGGELREAHLAPYTIQGQSAVSVVDTGDSDTFVVMFADGAHCVVRGSALGLRPPSALSFKEASSAALFFAAGAPLPCPASFGGPRTHSVPPGEGEAARWRCDDGGGLFEFEVALPEGSVLSELSWTMRAADDEQAGLLEAGAPSPRVEARFVGHERWDVLRMGQSEPPSATAAAAQAAAQSEDGDIDDSSSDVSAQAQGWTDGGAVLRTLLEELDSGTLFRVLRSCMLEAPIEVVASAFHLLMGMVATLEGAQHKRKAFVEQLLLAALELIQALSGGTAAVHCVRIEPMGARAIFELLSKLNTDVKAMITEQPRTALFLTAPLKAIASKLVVSTSRSGKLHGVLRAHFGLFRTVLSATTFEIESMYAPVRKTLEMDVLSPVHLSRGSDGAQSFSIEARSLLPASVLAVSREGQAVHQEPDANELPVVTGAPAVEKAVALLAKIAAFERAFIDVLARETTLYPRDSTCYAYMSLTEEYRAPPLLAARPGDASCRFATELQRNAARAVALAEQGSVASASWPRHDRKAAHNNVHGEKARCAVMLVDLGYSSWLDEAIVVAKLDTGATDDTKDRNSYLWSLWGLDTFEDAARLTESLSVGSNSGRSKEASKLVDKQRLSSGLPTEWPRVLENVLWASRGATEARAQDGDGAAKGAGASFASSFHHSSMGQSCAPQKQWCRYLVIKVDVAGPKQDSALQLSCLCFGRSTNKRKRQLANRAELDALYQRMARGFAFVRSNLEGFLSRHLTTWETQRFPSDEEHKVISLLYSDCGVLQPACTILNMQRDVRAGDFDEGSELGLLKLTGKLIARSMLRLMPAPEEGRRSPLLSYLDACELFSRFCVYGSSRSLRKAVAKLLSRFGSEWPTLCPDVLYIHVLAASTHSGAWLGTSNTIANKVGERRQEGGIFAGLSRPDTGNELPEVPAPALGLFRDWMDRGWRPLKEMLYSFCMVVEYVLTGPQEASLESLRSLHSLVHMLGHIAKRAQSSAVGVDSALDTATLACHIADDLLPHLAGFGACGRGEVLPRRRALVSLQSCMFHGACASVVGLAEALERVATQSEDPTEAALARRAQAIDADPDKGQHTWTPMPTLIRLMLAVAESCPWASGISRDILVRSAALMRQVARQYQDQGLFATIRGGSTLDEFCEALVAVSRCNVPMATGVLFRMASEMLGTSEAPPTQSSDLSLAPAFVESLLGAVLAALRDMGPRDRSAVLEWVLACPAPTTSSPTVERVAETVLECFEAIQLHDQEVPDEDQLAKRAKEWCVCARVVDRIAGVSVFFQTEGAMDTLCAVIENGMLLLTENLCRLVARDLNRLLGVVIRLAQQSDVVRRVHFRLVWSLSEAIERALLVSMHSLDPSIATSLFSLVQCLCENLANVCLEAPDAAGEAPSPLVPVTRGAVWKLHVPEVKALREMFQHSLSLVRLVALPSSRTEYREQEVKWSARQSARGTRMTVLSGSPMFTTPPAPAPGDQSAAQSPVGFVEGPVPALPGLGSASPQSPQSPQPQEARPPPSRTNLSSGTEALGQRLATELLYLQVLQAHAIDPVSHDKVFTSRYVHSLCDLLGAEWSLAKRRGEAPGDLDDPAFWGNSSLLAELERVRAELGEAGSTAGSVASLVHYFRTKVSESSLGRLACLTELLAHLGRGHSMRRVVFLQISGLIEGKTVSRANFSSKPLIDLCSRMFETREDSVAFINVGNLQLLVDTGSVPSAARPVRTPTLLLRDFCKGSTLLGNTSHVDTSKVGTGASDADASAPSEDACFDAQGTSTSARYRACIERSLKRQDQIEAESKRPRDIEAAVRAFSTTAPATGVSLVVTPQATQLTNLQRYALERLLRSRSGARPGQTRVYLPHAFEPMGIAQTAEQYSDTFSFILELPDVMLLSCIELDCTQNYFSRENASTLPSSVSVEAGSNLSSLVLVAFARFDGDGVESGDAAAAAAGQRNDMSAITTATVRLDLWGTSDLSANLPRPVSARYLRFTFSRPTVAQVRRSLERRAGDSSAVGARAGIAALEQQRDGDVFPGRCVIAVSKLAVYGLDGEKTLGLTREDLASGKSASWPLGAAELRETVGAKARCLQRLLAVDDLTHPAWQESVFVEELARFVVAGLRSSPCAQTAEALVDVAVRVGSLSADSRSRVLRVLVEATLRDTQSLDALVGALGSTVGVELHAGDARPAVDRAWPGDARRNPFEANGRKHGAVLGTRALMRSARAMISAIGLLLLERPTEFSPAERAQPDCALDLLELALQETGRLVRARSPRTLVLTVVPVEPVLATASGPLSLWIDVFRALSRAFFPVHADERAPEASRVTQDMVSELLELCRLDAGAVGCLRACKTRDQLMRKHAVWAVLTELREEAFRLLCSLVQRWPSILDVARADPSSNFFDAATLLTECGAARAAEAASCLCDACSESKNWLLCPLRRAGLLCVAAREHGRVALVGIAEAVLRALEADNPGGHKISWVLVLADMALDPCMREAFFEAHVEDVTRLAIRWAQASAAREAEPEAVRHRFCCAWAHVLASIAGAWPQLGARIAALMPELVRGGAAPQHSCATRLFFMLVESVSPSFACLVPRPATSKTGTLLSILEAKQAAQSRTQIHWTGRWAYEPRSLAPSAALRAVVPTRSPAPAATGAAGASLDEPSNAHSDELTFDPDFCDESHVMLVDDGHKAVHEADMHFDDSIWTTVLCDKAMAGSGVFRWAVTASHIYDGMFSVGVCTEDAALAAACGADEHGWSLDSLGDAWHDGKQQQLVGCAFSSGDEVQVRLDLGIGELAFATSSGAANAESPAWVVAFRGLPEGQSYRPAVSFGARDQSASVQWFAASTQARWLAFWDESSAFTLALCECAAATPATASELAEAKPAADHAASPSGLNERKGFVSQRLQTYADTQAKSRAEERALLRTMAEPDLRGSHLGSLFARGYVGPRGRSRPAGPLSLYDEMAMSTAAPQRRDGLCSLAPSTSSLTVLRPFPVLRLGPEFGESAPVGALLCHVLEKRDVQLLAAKRAASDGLSKALGALALLFPRKAGTVREALPPVGLCCTFTRSAQEFVEQDWFHCKTCGLTGSSGCCVVCALVCHKGHEVSYNTRSRFYCDCGSSGSCVGLGDCELGLSGVATTLAHPLANVQHVALDVDTDAPRSAVQGDAIALAKGARYGQAQAQRYVLLGHLLRGPSPALNAFLDALRSSLLALCAVDMETDPCASSAARSASCPPRRREEQLADWSRWIAWVRATARVPGVVDALARSGPFTALMGSVAGSCASLAAGSPAVPDNERPSGRSAGYFADFERLSLLCTDPCEEPVNAVRQVLAEGRGAKTAAVACVRAGVPELLLVRIGDVLGESPEDAASADVVLAQSLGDNVPLRKSVFGASQAAQAASGPVGDDTCQASRNKSMWRPGYGTGRRDTTAEDAKREAQMWRRHQRVQVSLATLAGIVAPFAAQPEQTDQPELDRLLGAMRTSCLLKVSHQYLFGNSVKSLLEQSACVLALLDLCKALVACDTLRELVDCAAAGRRSLRQLVLDLGDLEEELELIAVEEEELESSEGQKDSRPVAGTDNNDDDNDVGNGGESASGARDALRVVHMLRDCREALGRAPVARGAATGTAVQDAEAAEQGEAEYAQEMRAQLFDSCELIPASAFSKQVEGDDQAKEAPSSGAPAQPAPAPPTLSKGGDSGNGDGSDKGKQGKGAALRHYFESEIVADALAGASSKSRSSRVNRELRSLRKTLPVHVGSTILVRVDASRPFAMRALIFGPENTPYDSGAFLFDIYLPPEYPAVPPKIRLMTTGHGQVRFNPNLYSNGTVCLSLLGTWRGGASGNETWTSKSTLLQVLVSIQSAILGAEYPFFNEPGVESEWGTEVGNLQRRVHENGGYERLRVATLRFGILDALEHPPVGFETAVRAHFRLKRAHLLRVVQAWVAEATTSDTPGHLDALVGLNERLENLLSSSK